METQQLRMQEWMNMIREVFRVFKKRIESIQDENIKLSTDQFGLLHNITIKSEEVIQQDMAEIMCKDKSAILRLIDSLEHKGLVRRVTDLKDRRKNYLMVTKSGHQVLDYYKEILSELLQGMYKGITQEEIETFNNVIRKIKINAEKL